MQRIELEKAYNPASFEDKIYALWRESGAFLPAGDGKPYVVVIPPPNVTGVLHLGHALDITLQDIAVRFHRMLGERTLWVPGTDHAGIATQNVVEKKLRAKGIDRRSLGREKFVEETWKVKEEHHAIIVRQIERMGASVDWTRERFTMDEGLSRAVREVFVTLYERGLLYKGNYLVHWCPQCGTALSDDEVEHSEDEGTMTHIRYPIVGAQGAQYIEIATTRPETLLGDTALAVHPDDPRYKDLIGKEVELPLTGRRIPVIADSYVDREFGTGALKITPAHDQNDWELGKRHDLPVVNILTADGRLNDAVPEKYRGLSVKDARKAVVAGLEEAGLLVKIEKIKHSVGHCYRCNTVIEPYLSEQWFVRMEPLAQKALDAWKKGEIVFYPRKWENTYAHWLSNIRDWCISRQLWWGHRIPAWTCPSCGEVSVSRTDLEKCPKCGSPVAQDEDVLDTWFSSWLWPFSTLGWEGVGSSPSVKSHSANFAAYYPTSALVTGYDIIFFWVARMVMAGLEFTGSVPFRDIYIHGLLRDKQGRKMSKSLGNGIDPLEIIDSLGADALKFTLCFLCAQGQDIQSDRESFKLGAKFANKVWNAARYILLNLEGAVTVEKPALIYIDKWIYSRLSSAAKRITEAMLSYKYNEAASAAYEYFWNDFCDWYVEATKLSTRLGEDKPEKDRALSVLLDVLSESLKLLHPFLPFVTEEIYSYLPNKKGALITAAYPRGADYNSELERDFAPVQELVTLLRTLRSECVIAPEKKIKAAVLCKTEEPRALFGQMADLIKMLAGLCALQFEAQAEKGASILLAGSCFEARVFVADVVDIAFLKNKFTKEAEKDLKYAAGLDAKLANEAFVKNAPPDLVEAEKQKLNAARERAAKLSIWVAGI